MGNNQSLPPNSTGFLNPNFTTGNEAEPSLLDEEELIGYEAVQEARHQREHGGCVVANITETYGIDCFDNASRLQCFASMVKTIHINVTMLSAR